MNLASPIRWRDDITSWDGVASGWRVILALQSKALILPTHRASLRSRFCTSRCSPAGGNPGKEFQLSGKFGVSFSLFGDLRFLSHHDMLRLFARSVRRADLPIAHSQGYNPRPKIWLLLPRPLGVSCRDELLILGLPQDYNVQELRARLARVFPVGVTLGNCCKLEKGRSTQPVSAAYTLELSGKDAAKTTGKIPALLDSANLGVRRFSKRKGKFRELNIRPYLSQIYLRNSELGFTLSYSPAGSAKPAEVLGLLDLDNLSNRAKLVRTKVTYSVAQAEQSQVNFDDQEILAKN